MRLGFRGRLARFRRDARGTVSIEFGVVGLMFITGVLNAFELGRFAYERMQVENAAYAGAQAAWATCNDPSSMLPATQNQNCSNLNSAVTTAIQSTSLGTKVSLASTGITEGYYCVNASGALQSVGSLTTKPANGPATGNANVAPGDYIQVNVTFSYKPLLSITI